MIFQGPKGYIAQICEVHLPCSMETGQQNGRFTLFLVNSPLIYILFSLILSYYPHDHLEGIVIA